MRRFLLRRHVDVSGVSGTGLVAEGIEFGNGRVVIRWRTGGSGIAQYDSMDEAVRIHGHNGSTVVEWLDLVDSPAEYVRLYVAGPMTGLPEYNFPAFFAAEDQLTAHGYGVINPARIDKDVDGFQPQVDTALPFEHYMDRDIPLVLASDGVAVLPDWHTSKGARVEVGTALLTGRKVLRADDLEPVEDAADTIRATRRDDYLI